MSRSGSLGLAGWLFADAMLALTVVGLGSGVMSPPEESPVVTQVAPAPRAEVPTPKAPTAPSTVSDAIAVEPEPYIVEITVGDDDEETIRSRIAAATTKLTAEERKAAFVLTFGTSRDVATGTDLARRVNVQLDDVAPDLFGGAAKRAFWKGVGPESPPDGAVRLEMYLVSN